MQKIVWLIYDRQKEEGGRRKTKVIERSREKEKKRRGETKAGRSSEIEKYSGRDWKEIERSIGSSIKK